MKLKRFREVPHTYQMALVKTELVKGLARWSGGEELAIQPEDFEFDPWNPQKGGRRELCIVVLHSPHRYPGTVLPETGGILRRMLRAGAKEGKGYGFRKFHRGVQSWLNGQSAGCVSTRT